MAHTEQQAYCRYVKNKYPEFFTNKKILDIGSLDINGNNKILFENCDYTGLDVAEGPNVDIVSVGHLYDAPDEYYDTIISTEVFEHDMFYEKTIKNIIRMLKPGGAFIFTCASTGRPEHGTIKSDGSVAAPLLIKISEEWANYYKNLTCQDFSSIETFQKNFPIGTCEPYNHDLYFFGIKGNIDEKRKLKPFSSFFKKLGNNYLNFTPTPGPRVEITGTTHLIYKILFIDMNNSTIIYSSKIPTNNWVSLGSNITDNIKIFLESDDGQVLEFTYD